MRQPTPSPWFFWVWIGWVLFSQTGLAGRLANWFFSLLFASEPGPVDWKHFVAQKGYHVLLFAVFGFLVAHRQRLSRARQLAAPFAWCIGLGLFAESLQFLSANRRPSPWDALLNVVSALTAYWLTARAIAPDSRRKPSAPTPR